MQVSLLIDFLWVWFRHVMMTVTTSVTMAMIFHSLSVALSPGSPLVGSVRVVLGLTELLVIDINIPVIVLVTEIVIRVVIVHKVIQFCRRSAVEVVSVVKTPSIGFSGLNLLI